MNITANEKVFTLEEGTDLPSFLEQIGYTLGLVVVEKNKAALTPSEAKSTILQDGDTLEIVKIVAGG